MPTAGEVWMTQMEQSFPRPSSSGRRARKSEYPSDVESLKEAAGRSWAYGVAWRASDAGGISRRDRYSVLAAAGETSSSNWNDDTVEETAMSWREG